METTTKQDKLLFFGISFAALAALSFIINYVSPINGLNIIALYSISLILSSIMTIAKFDMEKLTSQNKNAKVYLLSGSIWAILAIMKWANYADGKENDLFIACIFSLTTFINWWSYYSSRRNQ